MKILPPMCQIVSGFLLIKSAIAFVVVGNNNSLLTELSADFKPYTFCLHNKYHKNLYAVSIFLHKHFYISVVSYNDKGRSSQSCGFSSSHVLM